MVREIVVLIAMILLFLFWFIPVTALAGLLSYKEIKKTWPALARLLDENPQIRAIVQNSLPSVAIISLNACLPFILEGVYRLLIIDFDHLMSSFTALTYVQGYRARSWIEYSLLKKCALCFCRCIAITQQLHRYFLYLLVNVVFIFLFASTYWQLVRDLANSPAKIPEKLAAALQQGNAR